MGTVVSKLFGGGDEGALAAQLKLQKDAQTTQLAQSINAEARSEQDLAAGSRTRGGRRLLTFLGGDATTLG